LDLSDLVLCIGNGGIGLLLPLSVVLVIFSILLPIFYKISL
jgi:hypothetical protein